MAEKELVPYIVHPSQYNPEYEKEVAEYMAKVVPLPKVTKKYKREAPPKFNNDYERELWEREEIRRCRVGYDGLPGKFYFYYNYVFIQKIEGGRIRPEFRGADLEWFRFVEDIQYKQKGWGIICIKRRRVGASWKEAADMLHDIIFNSHFHVGMNSKTEIDSMELFKKVSFVFDHLPSFLRPRVASKANDSLTLGISYVDKEGNKRVKGHQSYIVSKAPTQSAFEGFMLNKWIGDEAGKCFAKGTEVRMANGTKKLIEDIKIGDYVATPTGKSKVKSTINGIDQLYKIIPRSNQEPFICNSKHILTLQGTTPLVYKGIKYAPGEYINIPVEEYIKGEFNTAFSKQALLFKNISKFKKRRLNLEPYFLGAWLGDGFSANQVICGEDDEVGVYLKEYADRLNLKLSTRSLAKYKNNFRLWTIEAKDIYESKNYLVDVLRSYNLINNKHIPEDFKYSNIEDRIQLLAGLIDTDGYKKKGVNTWQIVQRNKKLSYDILDLVDSLGMRSAIREKIINNTIYYNITFNTDDKTLIKTLIKRKQPTELKSRRNAQMFNFDVEKLDYGRYFGIELEGEPYFMLGSGIVVHNCNNLLQMFAFTEDTMMDEYRRTGMPILFGTVGEVDGKGAGIFELWENAEAYNLKRFFFKGWMGLFVDQYGNDRIEESIRYIVYERKNQEKRGKKAYNDFLQRYPLDEDDAFAISTDGGLGDPAARNRQRGILMTDPPKVNRGYYDYKHLLNKGEPLFIADANGPVFMWESPEDLIDAYAAGCLPPGEKVLTDKGLKNIEEICSKDRLLSKDGEYVKIKEFQQYEVNEDVYEFKIKNTYRTTKFTGEHPLFISDNIKGFNGVKKRAEGAKYSYQKFDFGFKEVKNVKKGEWIKYPNIYKKLKPLDHGLWDNIKLRSDDRIDNPLNNTDFWWFVGHWLGDGHTQVSNTAKKVCISANKAETDTIKKVKHIITTVFGRTPYIRYKNNAVSIEFASTQLFEFLNNNFGKYAHGKYIPEWAKFMDNSYKLALVAGYLDADGSITKDKRNGYYYTEIVSINLELVESIQDILFSLGVISSTSKLRDAKTSKIRGRIINQKVTYRVRIGHYWLNKLIGLGVPSIKVNALPKLENSRSQNMGCFFDSNEDYIYFQILDITKSPYKGKVYNFHCETSTYLSKHITTHNCDPVDPNPEVLPGASLLSFMMRRKPIGLRPATTVMEITYRPKDVTEFYEQVVCALVHYKTKVLIESNRFDMISWFNRNGYKGMILPAPVGMTKITGGRRTQLGVRMIPATKAYMEGLIEAELEHNIEQVPSLKLLNELAVYGAKNTDRIIAWGLTLMQEAEMVNPARASAGTDIFAGLTLERGPNGTLRRVKTKFRKTAQEELPSHIKKRGPGAYVVGSGTTFDV